MPFQASDYKPTDAIYSFVAPDGVNIHIDSRRLREWCLRTGPEIALVPVATHVALKYMSDNTVNPDRVSELGNEWISTGRLEPIILGHYCDSPWSEVLLIDGHHRFVMAALVARISLIPAFLLRPREWQEFRIFGLPDLTREQLRASPVKTRSE